MYKNNSNLLNTAEAKHLTTYLEDFHFETWKQLQEKEKLSSFIFPFVELLFYNIKTYKSIGLNPSEVTMESYKDTCYLLDAKIEEYKIQ